jgi:hypothetical protein
MGWLSFLSRKNHDTDLPPDTSIHDWDNQPLTTESMPMDLSSARMLIKDAAFRTVQMCGIPDHWLSFEVFAVSDDDNTHFELQVLMDHWDAQMYAHSYAFECAVIKRVRAQNLELGRALRAVLWRIEPDAGCPYDEMPAPQYWSPEAIQQRGLVRESMGREIYAVTTPASGALLPPAFMRSKAQPLVAYGLATGSAKLDLVQENLGYSDTHPHNQTGFSVTHPHVPKPVKKAK